MERRFRELVETAENILVVSHVSPDPDATSSILLMGTTLQLNYPDKQIRMSAEELPEGIDFLQGYEKIVVEPLAQAIADFRPDLIIMLDAMNFERCTRGDWQQISSKVKKSDTKVVVIDHHEPIGVEDNGLYINNGNPATAQEVYELLFDKLKLKQPKGYAQTTMVGLYSDSGGFVYLTRRYRQTFKLAADLIEAGVSLEVLKNQLERYTEDQMLALGQLASNISHADDYSYSYLEDNFVDDWLKEGKSLDSLGTAKGAFLDKYIRNIDGRVWGFVVMKDPRVGDDWYNISLRAVADTVDVAAIAARLNGGGHKPAAGGKVQAANVQAAIKKVQAAIKG